ncbi:hypothetical protein Taro_008217 [Colocasia esculenta]|uniref:Polyketide cyclase/dehydrase and lipid transport superfamily protein n=1 Tax=Colocasia esculenta TaxID=4460 RepID=A0A843U2G0_COLES|nr:hypothetical protein [Colocasia esculenta]
MATEGGWCWWRELIMRPAVAEAVLDVLICAVPIWVAVMIGLVIGWSWRPRWTGLVFLGLRSRLRTRWLWTYFPPGLGARRLWLAFTALSAFSVCRRLWSSFKEKRGVSTEVAEGASSSDEDEAAPADGSSFRGEDNRKMVKELVRR